MPTRLKTATAKVPVAKKSGPSVAGSKKSKAKAAGSAASGKLSASLAVLLSQMRNRANKLGGMPSFAAHAIRSATSGPAGVLGAPPQLEKVHLLVRCDASSPAVDGTVELMGSGTVRTALVSVDQIPAMVGRADIKRLSAPRQLKPLMDIGLSLVRVPAFRSAAATKSSGRGVVIGVVDTGIDVSHPAFAGRVLGIWDQEMPGPGPGPGFAQFGKVLRGAQMGASDDSHGHGTHVAGIAAGGPDGFAQMGVAPEADLMVVKTNFQNSGILEGVRWIFSEAQRLGKPAVVNLSLGGHWDGHDGLDDLCVGLDEECGPGRLVVAAAGNEGRDRIHARHKMTGVKPALLPIDIASKTSGVAPAWLVLNGWYEGAGRCEVRVRGSTGAVTPWQGLLSTAGGGTGAMQYTLGSDLITLATPDNVAPNGARQFMLTMESAHDQQPVQGGQWMLEVRRAKGTPGTLHVWLLAPGNLPPSCAQFAPTVAAASELIGSPGAASMAVTVAAFTSRNEWVDKEGQVQRVGLQAGTVSDFSSPGPLRTGARKPDVTAPGAMLISARSSAAQVEDRDLVSDGYMVMAGTSMACPFLISKMTQPHGSS
jgi:subtilisin family serine protease